MKKMTLLLTALALLISCMAAGWPKAYAAENGAETGEAEYVRFTGTGFDPYASFEFSENGNNDSIDPDTVRWAAIRHRTASRCNEDNVEYIAQFYVYPPAEPFIPVHYNFSGEWETVIVDMTSVAALYGRDSIWDPSFYTNTKNIRLDPLEPDRDAENFDDSTGRGKVIEGDYIDIAWIAFFEKEDEAKAYTGTENTPYCILDADSLSSPFATHNLKAEYVSGKPVDPDATDAPAEISGPGVLFAMNYEDDINDTIFSGHKNNIEEVYFDKNCYRIEIPAGGDPYIELCFGFLASVSEIDPISADDYKVMQIGVRVNTEEGSRNGNIYWQTDENPGYGESQNYSYNYEATTDVQVVNIDFTKTKKWVGNVANLRYDPFPVTNSDTVIELYYMAFFTNLESAEEFGAKFLTEGLPATPVPTEKPTPKPTEVPTEVPPATEIPAATEVPAISGASDPEDTETDNSSKGLPAGAVIGIVAGAAAVAAAIAGVVISRAKKKG